MYNRIKHFLWTIHKILIILSLIFYYILNYDSNAVIKWNLSQTLNVLNKIFFILITYKRNSINIICIEKKKKITVLNMFIKPQEKTNNEWLTY